MSTRLATFYLLLVAILWGLTFPLIEMCVQDCNPVMFVAIRFFVASIPILPFFIRNLNREFLLVGAVLGLFNLGAFVFQTVGLESVNASRAAFLTGIYILMIPFISPIMGMGKPRLHDVVSAIICSFGIYILTGCNIGEFSIGDCWILLADVFIAVSIIYIGKQAKRNVNPFMLACGQIIMTGLYASVPAVLLTELDFTPLTSMPFLIALGICSFACTILAIFLQSKSQKYVSIQNTALIFSLEPVFAAVFDTLITGRPQSWYTLVGGMIILGSILYLELSKPKEAPAPNTALVE